ncbi:hypothetical protein DFH07DRAFT_855606 [Mycena maculata]|uniref:F-box domain-containing protein n=1 Tax=Mycena maculata TaxID=230809 RepID=A0AAD7HN72_9AGAR|nr:hypothetical protein DFH07DRAFT_855606 [Mycena maculata]
MVLAPSTLPFFSNEIILEVFEHLTDKELLSLAGISKHIHELALLSHLSRYGITENDIATNSFPPLSTSGALRACLLARFITGIDTLQLRFDESAQLDRDVQAVTKLVQKLPPIRSIDLEFPPRLAHAEMAAVSRDGVVAMVLSLLSAFRSRPAVTISPLPVSIIRPYTPIFHTVRRWTGTAGPEKSGPFIDDQAFREKMGLFTLMRVGGVIPNISIRAFDPPNPLGTLIVFRASGISDLRFPSDLRLSSAEISAIFENLQLPLLRGVEAALSIISAPSLLAFLCRHLTLQRLRLPGPSDHPKTPKSKTRAHPDPLPPDALPQLENIFGSAHLVAWVLASAHPFPHLTALTIELYDGTSTRDDYHNALHGIARRPAIDTLTLQINGWSPWNATDLDPAAAPERDVPHVADLRLALKWPVGMPRNPALLVEWFRLFAGLREVAVFNMPTAEYLSRLLEREFPNVRFTWYKHGR